MSRLTLGQIVMDCVDAHQLAAFYARLLEREIGPDANQYYALIPGGADVPSLMFLAVPEPRTAKNRLHLDLVSHDPAAAVDRAVELGATRMASFDEFDTQWTTLADPEGNLFDIGVPHGD